jgi:hypothetical protein
MGGGELAGRPAAAEVAALGRQVARSWSASGTQVRTTRSMRALFRRVEATVYGESVRAGAEGF